MEYGVREREATEIIPHKWWKQDKNNIKQYKHNQS